jgi:hypothetical protein
MLTTELNQMKRLRKYMELYRHFQVRLHGVVLNYLSTKITSYLTYINVT